MLPTIAGNASNGDLNNIDSKVLADLMNGLYKDQVSNVIYFHSLRGKCYTYLRT